MCAMADLSLPSCSSTATYEVHMSSGPGLFIDYVQETASRPQTGNLKFGMVWDRKFPWLDDVKLADSKIIPSSDIHIYCCLKKTSADFKQLRWWRLIMNVYLRKTRTMDIHWTNQNNYLKYLQGDIHWCNIHWCRISIDVIACFGIYTNKNKHRLYRL